MAYNVLAVVKATRRPRYGAAAIDKGVSGYYLVNAMAPVTQRLETLVEPNAWAGCQTLTLAARASWLSETAGRGQVHTYRTPPPGPQKPPRKRAPHPQRPPVSVAPLLAQRKPDKKTQAGTAT